MAERQTQTSSLAYGTPGLVNAPQPIDRVAAKAFRCALLFFLTPIPSALAVYYGVIGFRRARRGKVPGVLQAEIAALLGLFGLAAWVVVPYGFVQVRRAMGETRCKSNVRQIGVGLSIYATENQGHYPTRLQDLQDVMPLGSPNNNVMVCPVSELPVPPAGATSMQTSYMLLAAGMPADAFKSADAWGPADMILFEVSTHPTGNVVVLYGNRAVSSLTPDQVTAEAQKTLDKVRALQATTRPGI